MPQQQQEESKSPPPPPSTFSPPRNPTDDPLIKIFLQKLQSDVPVPIAGVQTLLEMMSHSKAVTLMGIQNDLKEATSKLVSYEKQALGNGRASISFRAGVDLFFRFVTRNNDEVPDFSALNQLFIARGNHFVDTALKSRRKIAELGHNFVQDGMCVLTHGRSEVVTGVLKRAAQSNKNFTVIITEGRPEGSGFRAADRLAEAGIPVTVILDSAVGFFMERVDIVLLGAEGVVESGGIVNKIGTCQMAMVAKIYNKPLYVAAESYKFARLYPLTQADLKKGGVCGDQGDGERPLLPPMGIEGLEFERSRSGGEGWADVHTHTQTQTQGGGGGNGPTHTQTHTHTPSGKMIRGRSGSMVIGEVTPAVVTTENPSCDYTPAPYISLLFTDMGILTPAAVSDELIKLYQ